MSEILCWVHVFCKPDGCLTGIADNPVNVPSPRCMLCSIWPQWLIVIGLICPETGFSPFLYHNQKENYCIARDWRDMSVCRRGYFREVVLPGGSIDRIFAVPLGTDTATGEKWHRGFP